MVFVSDFAFYIDTHEVTNAAYAAFLNAQGNQIEGQVTWLDMNDADALIRRGGDRFEPKRGYEDHQWSKCRGLERGATVSGSARDYLRRKNGGKPPRVAMDGLIHGEASLRMQPGIVRANYDPDAGDGYEKTAPVGSFPGELVRTVLWIWLEMCGSGWTRGKGTPAFYAAARGSITRRICDLPTPTPRTRRLPWTTVDFVAPRPPNLKSTLAEPRRHRNKPRSPSAAGATV